MTPEANTLNWLATQHTDLLMAVLKRSILAPLVADSVAAHGTDDPDLFALNKLLTDSPNPLETLRKHLWKTGQTRDTKDQLLEDAALDLGWYQTGLLAEGKKSEARRLQTAIDGLQQMRAQMWRR